MDYKKLLIKEYDYWEVYLNENQCYLGKVYIWAKRKDALDFFDMTDEEKEEYFKIGKKLKKVFKKLFNPDLYNYATLANVTPHLHTHVIPRYKDKRELFGTTFIDERWGKNYAPYNKDFKVAEDILIRIKEKISEELNKI
ncbi:MAG: HIT domain-containing protein [Nanoarchaeota archaeon]|nr:HIT domain-containing protein [Nanoarchaeota archaeon]